MAKQTKYYAIARSVKKKAFSCFEPALCKMVVLFFYKNFYQYSSAVVKCVE